MTDDARGPGRPRNRNVTVRDYRASTGLSNEELAAIVGANVENVKRAGGRKVPTTWELPLERAGKPSPAGVLDVDGLEPPDEPGPRPGERPPRAPAGAKVESQFPRPSVALIDYQLLASHVTGMYVLAGHSVRSTDPLLADAIEANADKAGEAWARWVESEPRVQELVKRLMIGTPMGELIGVHVTIVFTYVVARSVERERLAARAYADEAPAGSNGGAPAGDPVGEAA